MKRVWIQLGIIVLLFVSVLNVRHVLLGSAQSVNLQAAPPLSGAVSQAFTSNATSSLPVISKDYRLENTQYFDNKQWVVTDIKGTGNNIVTDGMVVLHLQDGAYTAVLGPGSIFPVTVTDNLPKDVGSYLKSIGATYVPVQE